MNIKTLAVLVVMGVSLSAFGQDQAQGQQGPQVLQQQAQQLSPTARACKAELDKENPTTRTIVSTTDGVTSTSTDTVTVTINQELLNKCKELIKIANGVNESLDTLPEKRATPKGEMICSRTGGYTVDYPHCLKSLNALAFVVNAEAAMDLQQQVRTDLKNKSIQQQANKQAAIGDIQTGMFDANIESNKHQKAMMQEKAIAYSAAVTALGQTYFSWPSEKKILERCKGECEKAYKQHSSEILANRDAKASLALKITEYIGKGIAAGIAMGQFNTAAQKMEQAKNSLVGNEDDVMLERCKFNPTDPVCAKPGNRVAGETFQSGDFSIGDGFGNNAFDMGTGSGEFGIEGDPSNLEEKVVAGANSPFAEDAKKANGILNPAAAASMQPGSGAGSGGGGAGGGGGGGSASLGSDLDGLDKDGNKEANIKPTKASGNYNAAGGGGYSAVKGAKDDANPFASLFDSKTSGGIEEDRSIASGDIDGSASGLFQKISKRYGQIQADKRIEANNLE